MRALLLLCFAGCVAADDGPTSLGTLVDLRLASPAFANGDPIPELFTCDGDDLSPPLVWSEPPQMTQMLAVVASDPTGEEMFTHWFGWGLSPAHRGLAAGVPSDSSLLAQGLNDTEDVGWTGPCPAVGEESTVLVRVWAVDALLDLPPETSLDELYDAIEGRVIGLGELTGRYAP